MAEAGIAEWVRERYFDAAGPLAPTKTHSRKAVVSLNKVVDHLQFAQAGEILPGNAYQAPMTAFANRVIGRCATRDGCSVPAEALYEDLATMLNEQPVRAATHVKNARLGRFRPHAATHA